MLVGDMLDHGLLPSEFVSQTYDFVEKSGIILGGEVIVQCRNMRRSA
jgi:hypothetical protein